MRDRDRWLALLIVALLLALLLPAARRVLAEPDLVATVGSSSSPADVHAATRSTNLLVNSDMDQLPFYWRPTNHYVAGQWFEWWGNDETIPEYIDGGIPNHNECYPKPANGLCHDKATGVYNSSQGYIRWGDPYVAGIYQPVHNVQPCTLYNFEIYNRNDGDHYRARVGIDPTGWIITRLGTSPPNNCPPDGVSVCPHPYVGDGYGFPDTMIWSAESNHPAYTWRPISLTVEAVATSISVWTYAAPVLSKPGPQSTYWDYGSVVQVPFPGNRLPDPVSPHPSGYIESLDTTFENGELVITWETATPASTQVLYSVERKPITSTTPISHTAYLPIVSAGEQLPQLDTNPVLHHRVTIPGLRKGDVVDFVALSRRVYDTSCRTETSGPKQVMIGANGLSLHHLDPDGTEKAYTLAASQ